MATSFEIVIRDNDVFGCGYVTIVVPTQDERSSRMLRSGPAVRRTLVEVMGTGALTGAMLLGGASMASAEPMPAQPPPPAPPGCSAGDLAQVSGTVGTAMAGYFFARPDVNNFFTSLRGLPYEEVRENVRNYLNANPQVETEINGIRQPLTDLRNRCDAPTPAEGPTTPLGPP